MSGSTAFDHERVRNAIRELLIGLGENPDEPRLQQTPRRIAESWREFYASSAAAIHPLPQIIEESNDLVVVRNIDFVSVCEHHLLPFAGVVHVAYQPQRTLLGLSDIPRLVRRASSRLQLQEGLTRDIATDFQTETAAQGVVVVMEARHGCVSDRGIRQARVRATTVAALGTLESASSQAAILGMVVGSRES